MPRTFDAAQTLLHIVVCNFCASRRSGSVVRLSYGFKHQHGKVFSFSIALFFHWKHSMTWHEDSLTWERREEKRVDEISSTDEIFTSEDMQSRSEMLPCLLSLIFFLFLTWHRGTCFPLGCRFILWVKGEVITRDCEGMLFILSPLPSTVLEIRLLSEQLKVDACSGRPVWQRPEKRNTAEGTVRLWSQVSVFNPPVTATDVSQV